jgi:hypothetical protein
MLLSYWSAYIFISQIKIVMKSKTLFKLISAILITLIAVNMIGCGLLNDETLLIPELRMQVENMEISQGDSFEVVLNVKNPSRESLMIKTSCKEFAGLFTYQEDNRVDFARNNSGCVRIFNTYELVSNGTLSFKWELDSSIISWNQETATTDATLAIPGEYLMQIRINVLSVNGQEYDFEDMEKMLTIR